MSVPSAPELDPGVNRAGNGEGQMDTKCVVGQG